ncbi:MAG: hypothetical protein QOI90_468 [Mycobacterium sp.]|jgi:hypothetical protein|nr:hypothetical protein [Mycobacterium sp.]
MGVFLEPGEEPVLRPESRIAIRRISAITVGTHQYGLVSGNSCLPVSAQCGRIERGPVQGATADVRGLTGCERSE